MLLGPLVLKLLFPLLCWPRGLLFTERTTQAVSGAATTQLFAAFPQ